MNRHVLIVDGNVEGREAFGELLRSWGHRVAIATSGSEGMHLVRIHDPDVVILDMWLPDVNGWDLVRRIRAEGYGAFVIGYSTVRTVEGLAREAGCDAYVVKPAIEPLRALLQSAPRRKAVAQ